MKSLGIITCILVTVFILFIVPVMIQAERFGESQESVAKSVTEEFCADVESERKLSMTDIDMITKALMDCGYSGAFDISELTFETAADGTRHQYMVSWDEILTKVWENGVYEFPSDCYVVITVPDYRDGNVLMNFAFQRDGFSHTVVFGKEF